jgi:aspartate/glutamate racemase
MSRPRIVLIHATPVAIDPIKAAFAADWPDAEPLNLMDDSLSPDRAAAGCISDELNERIVDLARYARRIGADGVLFTCSAFGSAIERAAGLLNIPVLKPNEAMFEAAIARGGRTAMIATFAPARATMEAEFAEEAERLASQAQLETVVVEPAMTALRSGDAETHNRLVAETARELDGFDTIVLAHFSTARAARSVRAVTRIPVLTSPDAAVSKLKRLITSVG